MKKRWYVVLGLGCLVFIPAILFGLTYMGLDFQRFFGPKFEGVRRDVFKETRSYNEGKEQELLKLRREYLLADDAAKPILASTIRHSFADYNEELLDSQELRAFLREMKYGH